MTVSDTTAASSHQALYRRYRPATFAQVEGQGEEIAAVARAVAAGTPHHAYLLTGPRGLGKTSTAKLIAAGLNCEHGPTDSPCGACYSCTSIAAGQSMDVQEIDAASSNSVDDIRELRQRTATVAAFGSFRVFILDEVHMLSQSAWNAFLKTLEEPPSHTVFVLCTTEAKKVPPTIQSRCHAVRFRVPDADKLASRIRAVCAQEGVQIDDGAAKLLGRAARGAYRDALGLLEQAMGRAGQDGEVTEQLVRSMLGLEDEQQVFAALAACAEGDVPKALAAAARLASDREPERVLLDLEALCRDVLICASLGKIPPSLQTTPARDELIIRTANALKGKGVARLLDEIGSALLAVRAGADARVRLELALVKTADPSLSPPAHEQTARRLDRLEAAVMSRQTSRRPTGQ